METETKRKARRKAEERIKIIAWSTAVKEAAGYVCIFCPGEKELPSNEIAPHHLKKRGGHPEDKYKVDNGLCVCLHHHTLIESNTKFYKEVYLPYITKHKDN